MQLQTLRKRALRLFTTPPEMVYAISRHWLAILVAGLVVAFLFLARAMTEPVFYQGRAALLVNPVETLIPEEGFGRQRQAYARDPNAAQRFLTAQAGILWSDSVLRKLVRRLGFKAVLAQEENLEKAEYGSMRRTISDLRERVDETFEYLRHPNTQDFGEENEMQRAIRAFRRRSNVVPDARANSIDMYVFGNDRRQIDLELSAWIWAYNERLEDMARESSERFLESRIVEWTQEEESARKVLDDFKARYPAVTQQSVESLREQIARLEVRRGDLERIASGERPIELMLESPTGENPRVAELRGRLQSLRLEEIDASTKYSPDSTTMRRLREQIELVEKELLGIGTGGNMSVADKKALVDRLLLSTAEEMTAKLVQVSDIKEKLARMTEIEDTYKKTRDLLNSYKFTSKKSADVLEQHKIVTVRTGDPPVVDTQAYEAFPYRKVIYGAFGGLGIGIVLALLMELVSTRVRFRNDVVAELGIPVIEVVPKR